MRKNRAKRRDSDFRMNSNTVLFVRRRTIRCWEYGKVFFRIPISWSPSRHILLRFRVFHSNIEHKLHWLFTLERWASLSSLAGKRSWSRWKGEYEIHLLTWIQATQSPSRASESWLNNFRRGKMCRFYWLLLWSTSVYVPIYKFYGHTHTSRLYLIYGSARCWFADDFLVGNFIRTCVNFHRKCAFFVPWLFHYKDLFTSIGVRKAQAAVGRVVVPNEAFAFTSKLKILFCPLTTLSSLHEWIGRRKYTFRRAGHFTILDRVACPPRYR